MDSLGRCFCTSRAIATACEVRSASSFQHDNATLRLKQVRLERQRLAQGLQRRFLILGCHLSLGHAGAAAPETSAAAARVCCSSRAPDSCHRPRAGRAPSAMRISGRSGSAASAFCPAATAFFASLARSQCAISVNRGSTALGSAAMAFSIIDATSSAEPPFCARSSASARRASHVFRVLGKHCVEALLRFLRLLVRQIQTREIRGCREECGVDRQRRLELLAGTGDVALRKQDGTSKIPNERRCLAASSPARRPQQAPCRTRALASADLIRIRSACVPALSAAALSSSWNAVSVCPVARWLTARPRRPPEFCGSSADRHGEVFGGLRRLAIAQVHLAGERGQRGILVRHP